jgi:capsular exopolysaccharide synthesis family protein
LAQLGGRILLIDADMRNPSLHTEFNDDNGTGLSSYLAGAARPPELLRETSTLNLAFLPAGPQPPNPAQLLSGPKMPSFLSVAMNIYDVVIVDGPPVMGLADAPILANMTSATLLVTSAGETRQSLVKQAIKRLHFARAEIIGVLLTKFDARRAGYTYGYGYGTDYYGYGNEPPKLIQNKDAEAA